MYDNKIMVVYKTYDGQEFPTYEDAVRHIEKKELIEGLKLNNSNTDNIC